MKSAEVLTYYDDGWAKTVRITLDHPLVKDVYVLEYDWVENVASLEARRGHAAQGDGRVVRAGPEG